LSFFAFVRPELQNKPSQRRVASVPCGALACLGGAWQIRAMMNVARVLAMKSADVLRLSEDRGVMSRISVRIALAAALAVSLTACDSFSGPGGWFGSSADDGFVDTPAETLYNEGLTSLNGGEYASAKKSFATLDKQYPYSEYTKKGLMLTTFAQYSSREYTDAISSGRRFLQLYPSDKDANYALYLVGMSYYNQIPDVGRDQDRAEKALSTN
jgi:TolA-binding protein